MPRNHHVTIIMGSKSDFDFCKKIGQVLDSFGVAFTYRIASAHKTPLNVLNILKSESEDVDLVYITVAGRSNALSGFVDANTSRPVIACPPYSEKFAGADILSSLRMPSGSGLMTVLEPEAAALAAIKILALHNDEIRSKLNEMQYGQQQIIIRADEEVLKYGKR